LQDRADFRFIQHDLVIPLSLDEDVAYFVHGASIASPTQYRKFPLQTIDVNVVGTRHLLELARRRQARSFVYLSSSEVYGDPVPEAIPTPESYRGNVSSTGPRACYDESKRLAETLCFTYYREFGLPVIVVRPFNVYGPRMRLDDGRVIPDFVRDALEGSEIRVFSDGRVTRSFCYVSDAITAILLLMVSDVHGEVFNIGNNEEITIEDLAYKVARLFGGRKVRLVTNPDANYLTDSPRRRCPDITKVCSLINWEPTVTLREGLGRTAKWYRTQERSL